MVDILGPLSDEEMEDLAKRAPDTFLEQDDILYSPKEGTERLFILKEGRVQLYEVNESGDEITLSVVEDGNVFGEMALTGQSLARPLREGPHPLDGGLLEARGAGGSDHEDARGGLEAGARARPEAARLGGPLRRRGGQGRPGAACHPDPYPGGLRRGGEQRELPHPHPLHPRAAWPR